MGIELYYAYFVLFLLFLFSTEYIDKLTENIGTVLQNIATEEPLTTTLITEISIAIAEMTQPIPAKCLFCDNN